MTADITTNLQALWKFDAGSGTTPADSSGNGRTGSNVNTPTWVAGRVGDHALQFNGATQGMSVASPPAITGAFTLAAWIKPSSTLDGSSGLRAIISKVGTSGFELLWNGTYGDFSLGIHSGGSFRDWKGGGRTLEADVWHHVAAVWDGSTTTAKLYLDGVEISGTKAGTAGNFALGATAVALGVGYWAATPGRYFPGTIDDVRVYDRALSAEDITALYTINSTLGLSKTLTVIGSHTFIVGVDCPSTVTHLQVEVWQSGAGGGIGPEGESDGGGGGAYGRRNSLAVTQGHVLGITIGAGGTGSGDSGVAGGSGNTPSIQNMTTDDVLVGAGDSSPPFGGNEGSPGPGGYFQGEAIDFDVEYAGGNGFGGGGSSAGTNASGTNATDATGASAPSGGGNGGDADVNGHSGSDPGGGGGSGTDQGGNGGTGKVVFTWSLPSGGAAVIGRRFTRMLGLRL